jgi:ABC-type antimicrobial peptide transport system permease subunit
MNLVVRTIGEAPAAAAAIRSSILAIDPLQPAGTVTTMKELLSDSTARERVSATLVSILALLALLLALTGVYGVVAWWAGRQAREMAIRMALGARRGHIMRLVLGGAVRIAVLGLALGLPGAWALGRGLSGQLFEIQPGDPVVFLATSVLLIVATILAGYVPARRAATVSASLVMRLEI